MRHISNIVGRMKRPRVFLVAALVGVIAASASPAAFVDTDGDLLPDSVETDTRTYISLADTGTDPNNPDTDGDGTPDHLEVSRGLDPNSAGSSLDRPNIIFILADDLGWGDLGVFYQNGVSGSKKHATPQLDALAAAGMQLRNHYCSAPVCAPSRATLLTGLHQGHAVVRNNSFDKALEDDHNLATVLGTAGYSTALIGKYGLQGSGDSPATWPAYPTKRGFDYFFGYVRHSDGHTHYPAHVTDSRGMKELYDQDTMIRDDLDLCYTADLFTARAKKLIVDETNANPNKPFFIYLAYDTPHAALQLPTQAYPSGGGLTGGLQWAGTSGAMINTASGTIDSYKHPDYTGKGWTDVEERFATSVRRIDDCVGDIVKTIEDLGIDDKTLVVFTSDNGPHHESYLSENYNANSFDSFGPFDGTKRDTWEGGIRMPTLVKWPGAAPAGSVITDPSQSQDWLPTFCELAGYPAPRRADGVSLVPTLTGSGTQEEGVVYVEYYHSGKTKSYAEFDASHQDRRRNQMQVILLDGYKGVRYDIAGHGDDFEIYDLASDPQEVTNLVGGSLYFDELQQRMKDKTLRVRRVDPSYVRPYNSAMVPPVTDTVANGVEYSTYEGLWPWTPEFTTLTSVGGGVAASLDLSNLTRSSDAGLLFTGYIQIPSSGAWNFYLSCDTGAHLRIHESQVVDDDYNHTGAEATGSINLAAGLHPFRLYYRTDSASTPALDIQWSGPGVAKQTIPDSALFRPGSPTGIDAWLAY
jgi:arylsulfatase A-like enzyme